MCSVKVALLFPSFQFLRYVQSNTTVSGAICTLCMLTWMVLFELFTVYIHNVIPNFPKMIPYSSHAVTGSLAEVQLSIRMTRSLPC